MNRSAHMTKEAEMLALADDIASGGSVGYEQRQTIADIIRAAARPAPAAGVIDREAVAEIIFPYKSDPNRDFSRWEKRREDALYKADAILALKPTMAGEEELLKLAQQANERQKQMGPMTDRMIDRLAADLTECGEREYDGSPAPAAGVIDREAVKAELSRFHRNSCYPDAMSGELDVAADAILALKPTMAREPVAATASQISELDDASNACLELATKHGFATGHGDTVADMIREFSAQIPAPSGRDPATIEACEAIIQTMKKGGHAGESGYQEITRNRINSELDEAQNAIRALAAPAVVTEDHSPRREP
jgi:hypothetical protein